MRGPKRASKIRKLFNLTKVRMRMRRTTACFLYSAGLPDILDISLVRCNMKKDMRLALVEAMPPRLLAVLNISLALGPWG
jgi:hypothetical protein